MDSDYATQSMTYAERCAADLERQIREYRAWRQRRTRKIALRVVVIAGFPLLMHFLHFHLSIWPLWWILGGKLAADTAAESRSNAARELERLKDPRATSALAMAAVQADNYTAGIARRALVTTLPLLRASDAHLVTSEAHEALGQLLSSQDTRLVVAILGALEQVGTPEALPVVQHLAATHRDAAVREAAEHCLPALQARAELHRNRATLLRPSAETDAPNALLRPAAGSGGSHPDELLRPAVALDDLPESATIQLERG